MIAIPDGQEIKIIESKAGDIVSRANALTVKSQAEYDGCADFLRAIKNLKKQIDQTFDDPIKRAHEAHKAIVAAKKAHFDPLDNAERIVKQKSLEWFQEERRRVQEEQRRLDEAARKAEERRKAELEAQAKRHEENGNLDKAQERRDMAAEVVIQAPIAENRVEKAEGQAIKTVWRAEVTDLVALCRAIGEGKLPPTMVEPCMKNLNALARTMQDKMAYPGVKFVAEQTLSVRV